MSNLLEVQHIMFIIILFLILFVGLAYSAGRLTVKAWQVETL
ncbi:MAG: hypothetical protein N2D54_08645 [Chloroflexota bacterium]